MLTIKMYEQANANLEKVSEICNKDWHGNLRLTKCMGENLTNIVESREHEIWNRGNIPERIFERWVFFSIIESIKNECANFVEVGAGYGEWCLAFDGIIKNKLVPNPIKISHCVAIEPDKKHCEWIDEHFEMNDINGATVEGVLSNKCGKSKINKCGDPENHYDQSILFHGSRWQTQTALGIFHFLTRNMMTVKSFTLDHLMIEIVKRPHIDLLHIDVQGLEDKVMDGAEGLIKSDKIDYMMIGTHGWGKQMNNRVKKTLEPNFDFMVDLNPHSIGKVEGFGNVECQDGMIVAVRKTIDKIT